MNSKKEMDELTQGAYDYIKENRSEDGKVIIYGYSWGGVLANHVAKRLKEDNIAVDILFLVDAANGNESVNVDRSISDNVKDVRNYYNPDPNSNVLRSHGLPVKANDESKTKVTNRVTITWNDGGKEKKVTHSNIDEATFEDILKQINDFLNSN